MQDFKELKVWQKAHELVLGVYEVTKSLPPEELYGLRSQMRRSAASIPTNIAEGRGRGSDGDFGRFLRIALGSAAELEYQLILCHDLGYIKPNDFLRLNDQLQEVLRMLIGFLQRLRESQSSG